MKIEEAKDTHKKLSDLIIAKQDERIDLKKKILNSNVIFQKSKVATYTSAEYKLMQNKIELLEAELENLKERRIRLKKR